MRIAVLAIFATFALIVFGLLTLLSFDTVLAYAVTCAKRADACVLEQRRLTEKSTATIPLHSLTSAAVELRRGGRGTGERVFLMLVAADSRYFAAEYEGWDARGDAEAAAHEVQAFLADPARQALTLEVSNPVLYAAAWIGGGLCLLLVLGGGVLAFRRVGRG